MPSFFPCGFATSREVTDYQESASCLGPLLGSSVTSRGSTVTWTVAAALLRSGVCRQEN